jgi:eukaryotic-like serine/threonine-protein kinase
MGWGAGTQVGSYEVVAPLGNGGMGEVYKVRHLISQRVEAMKVLLAGSGDRSEVADRFLREIRVLANLSHPNIAALHTAFRHENQLIMVMEFVEGMNLCERLNRGLTLEYSLNYIRQVLSALDYAHSCGVIHRDIKPSNVMITSAGQVKLLDFGLALMNTPDPRLTSSGSLLGSVHYISPEQIRGESLDARSGLYALGVTLYELVTGRLPIQGNTFPEIINGHLQTVPPAPSIINPSVPATLSSVVLKALAKNRAERYQDASEFLLALEPVRVESATDWAVTMEKTFVAPGSPALHPASPKPGQSRPFDSSPKNYDSAVLDDISKQLAHYIGPIAKVVVKRASSSSNNLRELCDKVAAEIDSDIRRKNFLVTVRKHLHTSGEL